MKKSLLILSFFFSFLGANAQFTSPNLGMHFTITDLATAGAATYVGGEYLVNQDLTLEATDTLSIVTNETIRLAGGNRITIKGTLIITPPDSVKITAQNPANRFHTLRFEGSTQKSIIRKTIVEYSSGIRVIGAAVDFDSCIVRNNTYAPANQSGAINVSGNLPVKVTNSKIYRNSRAGIATPANGGAMVIQNNWFFENGMEPGLHPQINLGPAVSADPLVISGNTIIGINAATNRSGGIAVANLLGSSAVTNILIENNIVRLNSYGVGITGGNIHGYIKGNLLENNNVNPTVLTTGSGINFNTTATNQEVIVARNVITGNHWGVTIQAGTAVASGPHPSLGKVAPTDTADIGRNLIYNNTQGSGASAVTWDLYNNTTDSIYAENNSWGTTNLTDIEEHIFHKADNANHGKVRFMPIFSAVSGLKALAENTINVYPNPASDFVTFSLKATGNQPTTLRLYNALGQEIKVVKSRETEINVNTRHFAKGLYSYKIETHQGQQTGKLVIVK